MLSFEGLTAAEPGVRAVLDGIRQGQVASVCLFKSSNVLSPAQLRELSEAMYQAARDGGQLPPLIGIDQEGGQLIAIANGATELPGNMALGATRSPELAEAAGRVLGRELLAMGINLDFAPALDVNTNPANPVVGIRSFGEDPAQVAALGSALITGMQAEGVIATAKHFPGHGDTASDSHFDAPVVSHDLERLRAVDLVPFQGAIRSGVGAVMTAHVIAKVVDPENPATLSAPVLESLLRDELGFDGLTITDAMDMEAVAQFGPVPSVERALAAGADLVLLGWLQDQFALRAAVAGQERPEAVARIERAQRRAPTELPPMSVVGCQEHQSIAQQIADRSITVVRDTAGRLPLRPQADDMVAVITVYPQNLTPADSSASVRVEIADAIRRRHPLVLSLELAYGAPLSHIGPILEAVAHVDHIVVGTIQAENDPVQADLVKTLNARGKQPVVVAMRTPYDLVAFPMVDSYLCAYGIRGATTEALARVLLGEIKATGTLPCRIPGLVELA
ncbi:MAG: beta-N-acetylhexosaminidase [Chloroflexi bacterium]|nr:beta-N-acetylhexosaminidase [Chloroflexota bacterium]